MTTYLKDLINIPEKVHKGDFVLKIERRVDESLIQSVVGAVTQGFGGHIDVVPRLFLREFVQVLDLVDMHDHDPRSQYDFNIDRVADGLTDEERDCMAEAVKDLYF